MNPFSNIAKPTANPLSMQPRPMANPLSQAMNNVAGGRSSGMTPSGGQQFAPTPSTPLKSTTMNNVDGSSITHTYHAPAKTDSTPNTGLTEQDVRNNLSKGGYSGLLNPQPSGSQSQPVSGTTSGQSAGSTANQSPSNYSEYATQHPVNTPDNSYSGLVGQGTQYLKQAGDVAKQQGLLTEAMQRETRDVMGNPWYSGSVKVGQAANIAQQEGSKLQALAAEQAALTQQGQAYATQAGNVKPIQLPYGTQYVNPSTGQSILPQNESTSALNPINNVSSIAQQVLNGQISPSQAYSMGGNVQNWQGLLNQEIQKQKPGFNTAIAEGRYNANQQNTTTSGTTPTTAAATSYAQSYNQLLDLTNTTQNVDQFGNLLLQSMKDDSGQTINPFSAKYANATLAGIRDQLSSSQQAVFDNTFASLKSRVSGLLAMGGSEIPTQITADANKIIDGSLPLSSLSAVLQRITTEGKILTGNLQNKLNTAGGVIGAPKSGTNNNPLGI